MINISNLHKYYNKRKRNETYALKGLELTFDSTGLVCILGESGCGKTTLLNSIGGLDSFDEGSIKVDDETIKRYKMRQIERIRNDKFGYIFQNYYLLSDRTVYENVMTALSMYRLSDEEKNERVEYVLSALGMTKYKKKSVSNLSGGQQQRVSIARALVKSPEIILADEPTGNLDEENTLNIMGILKTISKNCLVILVTHEREMARLYADRIIEMVDGRIISDKKNTSKDSYERRADNNIYLAEYKQEALENEYVSIELYKKADTKPKNLKIKLVFDEEKIFVKNETDYDILLERAESDFSILEGNAPRLTVETVQDVDFDMNSIKDKNTNKLPFKQIRKIAEENRRALGKKQAFMIVTILAAAVMLTLVTAGYINKRHINKAEVVTSDSHVIVVNLNSPYYAGGYLDKLRYCEEFVKEDARYRIYPKTASKASFVYNGIAQLSSAGKTINGACMVPIDFLEEGALVCGRMPENADEIVVDKMVLDKFISDNTVIGSLFGKTSDFLDSGIKYYTTVSEKKIVGVSDVGEPDIFMHVSSYTSFDGKTPVYAPLKELKAAYPGKYDNYKLEGAGAEYEDVEYDGTILFTESKLSDYFAGAWSEYVVRVGNTNANKYLVKDKIEEDFYADMVLSDEAYEELIKKLYAEKSGFSVYVYDIGDIDELTEEFKKFKGKSYGDGIEVEVVYEYGEQMKEYEEKRSADINAKKIVAMVVFILSIIVVYFSMKNNISARKEQIVVYRLIGINPASIIKSFLMEMGALTAIICIPAILITSLVLNVISNIKVLGINYYFSWSAMVILAAVIVFANIFVCYLSVSGMIKKPPVSLQ